jgi:hypothetical protein
MKISLSILAGAMLLASGGAYAQTCAAPLRLGGPTPTPIATFTGDTCAATNELGTVCIFGSSPGNDMVYTVHIAAPYTATSVTLTNGTPAWNPALLLLQGACNGNTPCPRNADGTGAGGNETLNVGGLADGDYLLLVTSTNGDSTCGSFTMDVNGNLPVTLQSFDVS